MNLNDIRNEIDQVDQTLVAALEKRMSLVEEVLHYKKQNHLPVLDRNREVLLLDKVASYVKNEEYQASIEEIFQDILEISRKYQESNLKKD